MSEVIKKSYELSLWEDVLETSPDESQSYYKELKVATIGSDTMTAPNCAFNIVLTENINGEKVLTFSIRHRYFDVFKNIEVENPFVSFLNNERKVKLYYNDTWYDFLIRESEETSEEHIFSYTAEDAFAIELGKVGYNVTFNNDLNNNQGTITKLAEKTLELTDWVVDTENSDLLQQRVKEPLYECVITSLGANFNVLNVDTNEPLEDGDIEQGETIYIFYSYVTNKNGKFIQFIREKDRNNFELDSEDVIVSTNYRIIDEASFEDNNTKIVIGDTEISIGEPYNENQGYRLVYDQLTILDPVMNRTVKLYKTEYNNTTQDIYSYSDYQYVTSAVLTSFVSLGTDFSILEDGQVQGWSAAVPSSEKIDGANKRQPLTVATYPGILESIDLTKIDNFASVRSFLELKFNNIYNELTGANAYFNSGIMDNSSTVDHIAAGERFVLRLKYATAAEQHGELEPYTEKGVGKGLRALVAKYEMGEEQFVNEDGTIDSSPAYHILTDSIILDFTDEFQVINNYINEGTFDADYSNYRIDGIVQTPSTKYCYREKNSTIDYVWDSKENKYVLKSDSDLDYYAAIATAAQSISAEHLSDPTTRIGVFLYTKDSDLIDKYIYLEDVQLTRYYEDANGDIVTIGNVPESQSIDTSYYYLKPTNKTNGKAINLYSSLNDLAAELGIEVDSIYPVYNELCEKILSIEESQSNCFNILQSLCETFECWLKLEVQHDDSGALSLDSNFNPIKKVVFKEYIGKDNFAGFKYGINLDSIKRTIDSSEFVTKLIVDKVAVDGLGTVTIQDAKSNYSKESYILNFSHYLNTGLIKDKEKCNADVQKFFEKIRELNDTVYKAEQEKIKLENALTAVKSKINVLESLIEEAQEKYTQALVNFETGTGMTYQTYVQKHNDKEEGIIDLLDNENVVETIAEIYVGAVTVNNYTGIVHNLKKEYNKLFLQFYGAKEYEVSITTAPDPTAADTYTTQLVIEDYIDGLDFSFRNDGVPSLYQEHFISNLNKRNFIATISNSYPFTHCIINKLPEGYNFLYYKGEESFVSSVTEDIDLEIYSSAATGVITKKYKLVPSQQMEEDYPNLDKIINNALEEKKELEKAFYKKYSRFIQEGTWSSNNHIDPELYYLDALQVSRVSAQPKVTYDIEVSEIHELEDFKNYYFKVGDRTYMEDVEFFGVRIDNIDDKEFITPIREEIVISKVEWHLDEPDKNTITVQNYKTQFEDLFQRISATVQTVQYNEITYPKISSVLGTNGLINKDLLSASWNNAEKINYNMSTDGAVTMEPDGILVQDLTKVSNLVKIKSGGIKVSSNGGQDWLNAIDGTGVNADVLTTGTINTQHISLMDGESPSFRWDKVGISAYGFNENKGEEEELYDFGTYVRLDKYGLYGIKNLENYVPPSLNDIKEKASFGLTWDGFFIKNSYADGYVAIDSDNDFQIVTVDEEEEFEIEPATLKTLEMESSEKQIAFPYDNCVIMGVDEVTDSGDVPITDYTYENKIITFDSSIEDGTFKIKYILKLDTIDIGGRGILEINRIKVNGNEYIGTFDYNKEEEILKLAYELNPGDKVLVGYKLERIKIGATKFVNGAPTKYGIEVRNKFGETVFETNDEGNLSVTGTINATDGVFRGSVYAKDGEFNGYISATSGLFSGAVTVGEEGSNYIVIDGNNENPFIASGNYLGNNQEGWFINGEGDATFNNVSVRGAIRTSVFEKGEIQTVGGAFMFRPSDVIERAELKKVDNRYDLVLTMKQKNSFKVGDLCKLGDTDSLQEGLKAVYMVSEVSDDGTIIVLEGAGEIFKDRIGNG